MLVLSDFVDGELNFCAQACGLQANSWNDISTFVHRYVGCEFTTMSDIGNSSFVHRHVGVKRFHGLEALPLCTGMWVFSEFMD